MSDELVSSIRRLIDSFPDYTHNINVYRNFLDLQKKLLEFGIETIHELEDHVGIENHLIYTPDESVGIIYYDSMTISISRFVADFYDLIATPMMVRFDRPHKDFYYCSFEDPTICAVQGKIFQAIFGNKWPDHVAINMRKTLSVKVSCNIKEKLK